MLNDDVIRVPSVKTSAFLHIFTELITEQITASYFSMNTLPHFWPTVVTGVENLAVTVIGREIGSSFTF